MNTDRLISSLCYFSIFFAGFILPVVIYFIVDSSEIKEHAKKAFLSHLIPLITIPFIVIPWLFTGVEPTLFAISGIAAFLLIGAINLIVLIWNVYKGVKVLID
ncbi:DUF4870 domain-containing protein [Bacillus sp. Marseille-P3661]|uniref:DUF4870 domain-containing protein n=1 Tax=Bacillus sp. Marseille-P3661 TaxID=1936234 RepID=UPI000C845A96|nr:DUF4870 domain-containing protein [Bacillus sp. Marseille-P3661]